MYQLFRCKNRTKFSDNYQLVGEKKLFNATNYLGT